MKRLLLACLVTLPLSAFSQSYMVLNNGVTLTTDAAGFIYDFNHFVNPYQVSAKGGRVFVEADKLVTIDDGGLLYRKDQKVKVVKAIGYNYLIDSDATLITVNNQGFHYVTKDKLYKKIDKGGANFFTLNDKDKKKIDVYTVTSLGTVAKVTVPGLNPADIASVGPRYLLTSKGEIYTSTKDGVLSVQPDYKVRAVKSTGGNFFVDDTGSLYTISETGRLNLPILPLNLIIVNIAQMGSNYMIDLSGRVFVVDNLGAVYEREVKSHDMRNVFILSR